MTHPLRAARAALALLALLIPAASAIPDEATREVGPCAATYDLRGPTFYEGAACAGAEVVAFESYYGWGIWCELRVVGTPVASCALP